MGCGGSKATTVAIDPANSQQSDADGGGGTPSTVKAPTPAPTDAQPVGGGGDQQQQVRRPSRVAPLGASTEDLQAEELPEGEIKIEKVTDQALAFVIPFENEPSEESIIRKHPPKRLQRLEEATTQLPTLEEIAEKQAVAEMRRQKILQNRVQSSKNIRSGKSVDSENNEDDEETPANDEEIIQKEDNNDNEETTNNEEPSKSENEKGDGDANEDNKEEHEKSEENGEEMKPSTNDEEVTEAASEKTETPDKEGVDY